MKKETLFRAGAAFFIVLFLGEIMLLGTRTGSDAGTTPTPTAQPQVPFAGEGLAESKVLSLSNQFLAECNATDVSVLAKVRSIGGVESAVLEQQGLFISSNATGENATSDLTDELAGALSEYCEGFSLLRVGYVLPAEHLRLSPANASSGLPPRNLSNYTVLAYAQSRTMPGVLALVDYRTAENSTAPMRYSVQMAYSSISLIAAREEAAHPPEYFSGKATARAEVAALLPRLVATCNPAQNLTAQNITDEIRRVNGTMGVTADANSYGIEIANESLARQIASILASNLRCEPAAKIARVGLLVPQNGSACEPFPAFPYNDRASFVGNGIEGPECKNVSFKKMALYLQAMGAPGIPSSIGVDAALGETVEVQLTASLVGGKVASLLGQAG
jgi:hypothetical protein